ncbi:hypothetical protein BU24DRAFT_423533 [Aaosphaeria arxii CBS 175.79]|uniref:Lipocalin-like domain-containing protein n=1 Tax=Aaosphaeria arxii CBS 175.79 TaxID=1450172 RepID=A0A6A5XNY8_9PLEO|nr:uncharacterized protein BU24DRAFT_423533 [Aaosphaeria arxii CBS 175.79]KAF2014619.1 hypothetical protein BU24DRAFT_423533 [Aaosphaeria arxii CBS 175.79]
MKKLHTTSQLPLSAKLLNSCATIPRQCAPLSPQRASSLAASSQPGSSHAANTSASSVLVTTPSLPSYPLSLLVNSTTMSSDITLRSPSSLKSEIQPSVSPPTLAWLQGSWNVTHSTLPMWKKSRNVRITYKQIPNTSPAHLDDLVTYQSLDSTKLKTVRGIDKPFDVPGTAPEPAEDAASPAYQWRGKGWLAIASSKWEILGYGDVPGSDNQWVVTYFAKTLFTPAGVDFYSRKGGLNEETIEKIKAALAGLGGEVANLAKEIFPVKMDDARTD